MLERVIKKEPPDFYKDENQVSVNTSLLNTIKDGFNLIEQTFGIEIPVSELCYVVEIFLPYTEEFFIPS